MRIEDCWIEGFVVGICLSPTGQRLFGARADDPALAVSNSIVRLTKSAISLGQQRKAILQSVGLGPAKYAINCIDHGGPGDCPSIFGAKVAGVKFVFNTGATGVTAVIDHLHVEQTLSLGHLGVLAGPGPALEADRPGLQGQVAPMQGIRPEGGAGTLRFPPVSLPPLTPAWPSTVMPDTYRFTGCDFVFANPDDLSPPGPAVNAHLVNRARTLFSGCCFSPSRRTPDASDPPLHIINLGQLTFTDCTFTGSKGKTKHDLGPQFWVSGETDQTTYHHCAVADRRTHAARETFTMFSYRQCAPDFLARRSVLDQTIRGAFFKGYALPAGGVVGPALHWVSGAPPRILLGHYSIKDILDSLQASIAGSGHWSLTLPMPLGVVQVGDLITSDVKLSGGVENEEPGEAELIFGRVTSTVVPPDPANVRISFVPARLMVGLRALRQAEIRLYVVYFPRLHPPTQGRLTDGSDVIRDVSILLKDANGMPAVRLEDAWAPGHRISGFGLPPGTYVVDARGDTLWVSQPALLSIGPVLLFDADVRKISLKEL